MTAAAVRVLTAAQVRAMVNAWLARDGDRPVAPALALRARPQWSGEPVLELPGGPVRVVPAVSPLAVRAALVDRADGERLVLLTECDDADLGTGLLTYLAGNRVLNVEAWQIVQAHFRAAALDPALVRLGRRVAEALLEYAPAGGWPPVPDGLLTRDRAMRGLAAGLLGVEQTDLDATGLVQWTLRGADVVRYAGLPEELRAQVAAWLTETAGPVARIVMACVAAGNGTDAIPLGVVAGLLWDSRPPSPSAAAARARAEAFLGGWQPRDQDAAGWSEAALSWAERMLGSEDEADRTEGQRVLGRAEHLARQIGAEAFLTGSDLLPAALEQRLRQVAGAVSTALARPSATTLAEADQALRLARAHRLAAQSTGYHAAEAAVRALRWLSTVDGVPQTLAEAVRRQVTDDGWVDRARLRLWVGVSDPALAQPYRTLYEAVEQRRVRHDEQFARLLAAATADNVAPGGLLLVEDVLDRVVRPMLDAGRRVLLIVVDGMGVAASTSLVESLTRDTWWELTPSGGPRTGALAALPTVTEVNRTSLLSGRLSRGGQPAERAGLAEAIGPDAVLFHKADLVAGSESGETLGRDVVAAVQDPQRRLVAAVVNTIDDALDRSDPAGTEWTRETVRLVDHLLDQAGDRVVVLVSDHGHVVDRGPAGAVLACPDATSARWRPASSPPQEGEIVLAGARVVLAGGQVVLPWRENLRYTPRKAGYHGGASPAEAVIPLAVLVRGTDEIPGWAASAVTAPAWWRGPVPVAAAVAAAVVEQPATPEGMLFDIPAGAEPAGLPPLVAEPRVAPLVAELLGAAQYKRNRKLKLAGQPMLPDERVAALLGVLLEAGGRLRMDALAERAGVPPQRIAATVTVLRRLLSVEGYQSVTVDADGHTVLLDQRMLRDQFGLEESV